ncbi:MAG: gliding motility-associated C-terminal domain-containing protein, partial [Crocinitomicaceae bacterium]|nr:gliding motility-associated C-terminal domain-containing protein [Crocinitomicaceae bacterium]
TSVPNGGTATVSDLNDGSTANIQVTDAEGCIHEFSLIFDGPTINDITITPAATCPTGADGDVDVTVIGGAGFPYAISMNGDVTPAAAATYSGPAGTAVTVVASDADGCIADSVVTITSAGHFIDVTVTAQTNVSCFGANDGSATITAEPVDAFGAPDGTVVAITWDPPVGAPITGPGLVYSLTDMMPGTWLVTILDDTGCEVTIPIEITSPDELDIYVSDFSQPVCYGFSDGSITVAAVGGSGGYDFSWDPTNPVPGNTFNTVPAGDYWAYVTDANGCQDSVFFVMDQPDSLWAEFILKDIECFGDFSGSIVADTIYNAVGVVSYFWNLSGAVPDPPTNINVASGLPAGTYVLTIQDENCSNEYTFTLETSPPIELIEFESQPAYCRQFGFQSGNGVVLAAATGGTPDYSYLWTNLGTGETNTSTTWGGLNPGTYQITVIDDLGCVLTETIEVDSVSPIAEFNILSDELDQFFAGTAVVCADFVNESQYFANPNNPNADTTFFWTLGFGESPYISQDYNEVIDTCYTDAGVYEVCLVAINKNGCTDTTCKEITVFDVPVLVAPNVFTPDGDGVNDVFTFNDKQTAIIEFECIIFDRWGLEIVTLTDVTQSWDGTTEGGKKVADGVYFYKYTARSTNDTVFEGQGSVTKLGDQ